MGTLKKTYKLISLTHDTDLYTTHILLKVFCIRTL